MSFAALPGSPTILIGPSPSSSNTITQTTTTLDAANEALICIGRVRTADGGSHTIDTTGSSSIGFLTGSVTFANAGTSLSVGIAAVDTTNGPAGRAVNVADVTTFDVKGVFAGGGGGITGTAWQTKVPTTGTKTIANGDLVAVVIQMTARAGADTVGIITGGAAAGLQDPVMTSFVGGSYSSPATLPNAVITFSDGTLGWLFGGEVFAASSARTFNSGSSPNEYGQLYEFPFPVRVSGLWGWVAPGGNFELILYSDPLGTPVAERTLAYDANAMGSSSGRRITGLLASAYDVPANTPVAVVMRPTTVTNLSAYYKTLASATHRAADPWGTSGYGVSRSSGAFGNANSSLDHYFLGLMLGGFEVGGGGGRNIQINNPSLVA
jgi:hypothetical protein